MANFIPRLDPSSCAFLNARWILKQYPCPHCKHSETLKSHGMLHDKHGKPRGMRLFCSNRNSNKGCGRTLSVFFDDVIPRASFSTPTISRVIEESITPPTPDASSKSAPDDCSRATAYRWIGKTQCSQENLRSHTWKLAQPPRNEMRSALARTWQHLRRAFPSSDCLLSAFQSTLQINPYQTEVAPSFPLSHRADLGRLFQQLVATRNEIRPVSRSVTIERQMPDSG